ncbi:MAG: hypothetical protein H0U76_03600, partial [Ktedonobacteraceae bacterium]|nr:hypothetical protein [Ktedonobacteraceae bacterium]
GHTVSSSLIFKLKRATLRFIRNHDLSALSVQIDEFQNVNYATISWQWPASPLIKIGLLVWHTRMEPGRPSEQVLNDPYWPPIWVRKRNNVLYDSYRFPIGHETSIYVRSYAAFLETWDNDGKWRFSDGHDPTTRAEAVHSQIIRHMQ